MSTGECGELRAIGIRHGADEEKEIRPGVLLRGRPDYDQSSISSGGVVYHGVRVHETAPACTLADAANDAAATPARRGQHKDVSVDRVVEWMTKRLEKARSEGQRMTAAQIITAATAKPGPGAGGLDCNRSVAREALGKVREDLRPPRGGAGWRPIIRPVNSAENSAIVFARPNCTFCNSRTCGTNYVLRNNEHRCPMSSDRDGADQARPSERRRSGSPVADRAAASYLTQEHGLPVEEKSCAIGARPGEARLAATLARCRSTTKANWIAGASTMP